MLVAVVWVVASVWRRQSKPYPHLVPLGVLFTVLLFIPGCVGVAYLYDAVVYREFGYDSPPGHVFRYRIPMPDCAKSIRVRLYASGHRAVFKVPEAALGDWMRSLELEEASPSGGEDAAKQAEFEGWTIPPDTSRCGYRMLGANGASISVWYSRSTQTACTAVNYW